MTNLKKIADLPEVAKLAEWNGRYYVHLTNLSRNSNGDRNLKIWVKDDAITMEPYKGYLSDGAIAGITAIENLAAELGMTFIRR